jgi:YtxH-like protein
MAELNDGIDEDVTADGGATGRERRSGSGGLIAGFVLGTLLGASLALLFAPDSGQETRRHLRRRMRQLRHDAAAGLEKAEAHARRRVRRGRGGLRDRMGL